MDRMIPHYETRTAAQWLSSADELYRKLLATRGGLEIVESQLAYLTETEPYSDATNYMGKLEWRLACAYTNLRRKENTARRGHAHMTPNS